MRKDTCIHCGGDLHACVQCRFHDPGYHNQCREPQGEMVRDRERANLCDYFEFSGATSAGLDWEGKTAKQKLDELFKKT